MMFQETAIPNTVMLKTMIPRIMIFWEEVTSDINSPELTSCAKPRVFSQCTIFRFNSNSNLKNFNYPTRGNFVLVVVGS